MQPTSQIDFMLKYLTQGQTCHGDSVVGTSYYCPYSRHSFIKKKFILSLLGLTANWLVSPNNFGHPI